MGLLHAIWEKWRAKVAFFVVYIREAHPEDGWVVHHNRAEDIVVTDPTTNAERLEVASTCALRLRIRMPVVVDDVDDAIASAYGALPERLYLIARGGRITYRGGLGPWGFRPAELDAAIEAMLGPAS